MTAKRVAKLASICIACLVGCEKPHPATQPTAPAEQSRDRKQERGEILADVVNTTFNELRKVEVIGDFYARVASAEISADELLCDGRFLDRILAETEYLADAKTSLYRLMERLGASEEDRNQFARDLEVYHMYSVLENFGRYVDLDEACRTRIRQLQVDAEKRVNDAVSSALMARLDRLME